MMATSNRSNATGNVSDSSTHGARNDTVEPSSGFDADPSPFVVADAVSSAPDPTPPPRARLPETPARVVLMRRARAITHSARTLITENPWLAVALATGVGLLVGRVAPTTFRRRVGLGLVGFVGRRAASAMLKAIEDSLPSEV